VARVAASRANTSEDYAPVVEDEADVPVCLGGSATYVGEPLTERAGRHVCPDVRAGAVLAWVIALERKSGGSPVGLAGCVVVDLGEAEAFEPRRGS